MRIGIDARPLVYPKTGIGRYTSEVIERLLASEHELCLYTHTPATQHWLNRAYIVRAGGIRFNALSTGFAQLVFPLWAKIDRVDVFWSPRHHLPLALAWGKMPCAVTIHDLVWKKTPQSMRPMARLVEAALMPPSLRAAKNILVPSKSTSEDLETINSNLIDKTTITPLASHFPPKDTITEKRTGNILFVGTFEPRKNIPLLIEAFTDCTRQKQLDLTLHIAGQPGWKFDIDAALKSSSISDRIVVHNPINDREMAELYLHSDFLVLPSSYEGFGLPIVEAMSFGKPVICSNISSMPEVVGEAGLIVAPDSCKALSNAIYQLSTDKVLYTDLSHAARRRSRVFTWHDTANATRSILEKTAKKSTGLSNPHKARGHK